MAGGKIISNHSALHIVRGCLLVAIALLSSCDLFGPKQMPPIPIPAGVDSSGKELQCVVKIRVDGDSFYLLNDTVHKAFSDLAMVDSLLPKLVSGSSDSSVVITWTGNATYGNVIEVIDVLKKNGIRKYALTKDE